MDRGFFIQGLEAETIIEKFEGLACGVATINEMLQKLPKPTDYLTRNDVAEIFKVSLVTVSDWTAKGLLKSYKLVNRVYYKRGEIEQALTEITPKR